MTNDLATIPQEVNQGIMSMTETAKALVVASQGDAELAVGIIRTIKGLEDSINETFDPVISQAFKAHKTAIAAKDLHAKPLKDARLIINGKVTSWQVAERARVAEEQRALQAAAQKAAQDALLAQAASAESEGDEAAAEELLAQAEVTTSAPAPRLEIPKIDGTALRTTYKARVVNMRAFLQWIILHPGSENYVIPNESALNSMARGTKGNLNIDGVVFEEIHSSQVRG
jgi:hypothetical protein